MKNKSKDGKVFLFFFKVKSKEIKFKNHLLDVFLILRFRQRAPSSKHRPTETSYDIIISSFIDESSSSSSSFSMLSSAISSLTSACSGIVCPYFWWMFVWRFRANLSLKLPAQMLHLYGLIPVGGKICEIIF